MIELYAIYRFCQYFGKRLRAKGRQPIGFQFLFILMWFTFEIVGAMVGYLATGEGGGVAYLFGLMGAFGAVAVMTGLVRSMTDRHAEMAPQYGPPPLPSQGGAPGAIPNETGSTLRP